jgi:ELWxxDGT repeat protein
VEQLESREVPSGTPMSSNVSGVVNINGTLYFGADDGSHGSELWKSNGSADGTVMVEDINPGINGSNPGGLMNVNGTLFFSADDEVHGRELWKSDGTADGTVLVKDILPGSAGNTFLNLLGAIDGRLFFSADDGVHGKELWVSDGTEAGTTLFKDINPGSGSSFPVILTSLFPQVLKDANGLVYMQANDGVHGTELWRTDGTPDGTVMVKDINPGINSSTPGNLLMVNGKPLFLANDGTHGNELWTSDGTEAGTVLIKDINPGSPDSFPEIVRVINNTYYFSADDGVHGRELWKSDGTADGTVLVKDIFAGPNSSNPFALTDVNGTLFFTANDGIHGQELWMSNGSADGTVMVKDINPGSGSTGGPLFGDNGPHPDGVVLFPLNDGVHGFEVWRSDGTADGTYLVKDINPGPGNGVAGIFFPEAYFDGTLYFNGDDGIHGQELWKSDGTADGTVLVKDINPIGTPHSQTLRTDFAQATETVPVRIDVLANDSFAAGISGTITAVSAPTHGSAVLNSDGTITYTSSAGFSGDDFFTYTVTDTLGEVDSATVRVTVFPKKFLQDDQATTSQDTPVTINVLANDLPTPGAAITAVAPPAHGSAILNADGTIAYTPAPGFFGIDAFTYTVRNSVGGVDTATVTVQVIERVQIDIKPGDTTNAINLNNDGTITVALFSSATFDARTVDVASVQFAGASASRWSLQDVNHDGRLDLVLQFGIESTSLRQSYVELLQADASDGTLGTTRQEATFLLTGSTQAGQLFEGLDTATLFLSGKELRGLLVSLGIQ